jgi:hypothetical protein
MNHIRVNIIILPWMLYLCSNQLVIPRDINTPRHALALTNTPGLALALTNTPRHALALTNTPGHALALTNTPRHVLALTNTRTCCSSYQHTRTCCSSYFCTFPSRSPPTRQFRIFLFVNTQQNTVRLNIQTITLYDFSMYFFLFIFYR